MSRASSACDTDALCQGQTKTCWYVATVTFMWKLQDFLRKECGIEFNAITKQFLRFTVGQCDAQKKIGPGSEKCLMLPPGVDRAYKKRSNLKGFASLQSGGMAIDLLIAFFDYSNIRAFHSRRKPQDWQIGYVFREFDVVAIDKPPNALGFAEADPQMTAASGAIMMMGMMAEARDTPKTHVLIGAFVRVRHSAGGHVITIVRCHARPESFMVCDSSTGQCYDGAKESTFLYGNYHATIRVVSFIYARKADGFSDIAI